MRRPLVIIAALVVGPALLVPMNAEGAPAHAPSQVAAKSVNSSRWCLTELESLPGDVCVANEKLPDGQPRTLVIFLHGVIAPNTTWQWTQHLAMKRAAEKYGFAAIMPPAPRGDGPKGMGDVYAWPTSQVAQKEREPDILRTIQSSRRLLEERAGKSFDDVFVMGFSSGAYYATSLALRGKLAVDGFGLFAGGAAAMRPSTAASERRPIYVGVCTKDETTSKGARNLGGSLAAWGWPSRMEERPLGHMFTPEFVGRAVAYLRAKKRE